MKNKTSKNKFISFIADGIASGVLLCIGCAVSLSIESKLAGSFLFSLGLFAIITFKFGLYTGKAGYMAVKPYSYIGEVALTLLGNIFGTAIGGGLINLTKLGDAKFSAASDIISTKVSDNPLSIVVLAIFCGILMFTAVEGNKRANEKNDNLGALFIMVLPVMVFILCGFNHCVADFAYFFISRCAYPLDFIKYIILVIMGNAVGCMSIPIIKRLSINE